MEQFKKLEKQGAKKIKQASEGIQKMEIKGSASDFGRLDTNKF